MGTCWNKCQVCGRFIEYEEFEQGSAKHKYYLDTSGLESWDTYHVRCEIKEVKEVKDDR